jgi:hypothetical protein
MISRMIRTPVFSDRTEFSVTTRAQKGYEDAMNAALPEMLLAIIREQYASVKAAHGRVRDWRDG